MNSEELKILIDKSVSRKIRARRVRVVHIVNVSINPEMMRYYIRGFGSLYTSSDSSVRMIKNKVKSYEF